MKSSDLPLVIRAESFRGKLSDYSQASTFQPLESSMFTVTLTGAGEHRKLFKVQFRQRSNQLDLAVHLPYFEHHFGKVGAHELTVPPGGTQQQSLIGAGSFTTTQRVKLSHHADGTVLFSQDARVISKVRAKSTPVNQLRGHFFTFHFWGLNGYEVTTETELTKANRNRATVYFGIDDDLEPRNIAGRIVGYCYPRSALNIGSAGEPTSDPRLPLLAVDEDNKGSPAIILAPHNPPRGCDIAIVLTYKGMERSAPDDNSTLMLVGGFNSPSGDGSPENALTYIWVAYSAKNDEWDEIVRQLGSIDYTPDLLAPG